MRILVILLLIGSLVTPALSQPKELKLFAWSEYVPKKVIDGFEKETGIQVTYDTYASDEELLAALKENPARADLVMPSEWAIEKMIKADQLAKLDKGKLTNLKNIDPAFTARPYDPKADHSVPWMAGTVGIVINTEKIKEPIAGFKDLFQPKYAGRIIAVDDPRELVFAVTAARGLPTNDLTDKTLADIKPTLAEWMKMIRAFESDNPKKFLLSGEVDLGLIYSGEAAALLAEDAKFTYVLPAEGTHQFVDSLAIPKSAPNPSAAHLFIDYILRPQVSRQISEEYPYTNPNVEARKLLSKEELANPASYPPGKPRFEVFRDIGPMSETIEKLVDELKPKE